MNNNRIFTLTTLVNLLCKGALKNSLGSQEVTILFYSFVFVILFCITKPAFLHSVKPTEMHENLDKKKHPKKWFIIIQFVFLYLQIYSLVLQGRINDVRELLAQHPEKQPGKYDVRISLGFYYFGLQLHRAGLSLKSARGQGFPLATISITPGYILRKLEKSKVEPLLSGHPRGTSKWQLNGGWPLSRGSSEISIIFSRNITLFWNKCMTGEALLVHSSSSTFISDCIFLIKFLKWGSFKCIEHLMAA